MSFVGAGGNYVEEVSYKYVGNGAGQFDLVGNKKFNCGPCVGIIIGLLVLAVVLLLLFLPQPPTTTTTPLTTSMCNTQGCDATCLWDVDEKGHGHVTCRERVLWARDASVHVTTGSLTEAIDLVRSECQCACAEADFSGDVTTAAPPMPSSGTCLVWGDPHMETFDSSRADFYDEGDVWLVKSAQVSIQARYKATPFTNGLAATNAIAVGGPFLEGHVLKVGPMENGQITWDNQPVLANFPSEFDAAGLGKISYNGEGQLVDDAQANLDRHIVHMDLPQGVHLQVMRWANHINVRISMPPMGQDGHCGNFNGDASDDSTDQIKARMAAGIPQGQLLFRTMTPNNPSGNPPNLEDCPAPKLATGEAECKKSNPNMNEDELFACKFDYCFGGEQYVAQDAVY